MSYEELRDAVAKAIGSPSFHNQPPGEHWWANLFDDHRYPYRVKADAAISVIAEQVDAIVDHEWIKNWKDGQFDSRSRDKDGWPIEMHGLVMDLEKISALLRPESE